MVLRILSGGAIAAIAGAAMLAASSAPSPAFTLSTLSPERPVAAAGLQPVQWHEGWHGGWHHGWHGGWRHGWHGGWRRGWGPRWGWGPPVWGWGPVLHCWWTPWGRRCGWA